ncbi:MAG: type II CAAX endopeptidase family protein [Candidatus Hermodarchaeota archaeon]|nr:type II CAAX endopeptidase family protein [Candidatus Hermodarchaeota archaeon]
MVFKERDESIFNFLTPTFLFIIGLFILAIGAIGLILINFWIPVLIPDGTIASLQVNLFGQIVGILVIFIFLLPLFRLKLVEVQKPTIIRTLKTFGIACLALTMAMLFALALWLFFTALGMPIQSSYTGFILTPAHLVNPWNIVLLFATVIFGAAIFEELIFRRMLIPALEHRGMGHFAAVIASSLGFALIHVPNDVINGSISFVISHFVTTFTLGLFLGFTYVATRNVLFPMIIHGFINAFAFSELILESLGDFNLLVILALIMLVVWVIGVIIGAILLIQYLKDPKLSWVTTIWDKSRINILPGLAGYLIVGLALVSLQVGVELIISALFFPNVYLIYSALFLFYIIFFFLLIFFVKNTTYEPQPEELKEPDTRQLYDTAQDVTLEPPPE